MYLLCTKKANEYFMLFSASFENINHACHRIDDFLRQHGLEEHAFAVGLGAREILNNAIEHGSQSNPARKIRFRIFVNNDRLFLRARDEGNGYRASKAKLKRWNILKESGRGLVILNKYFDSVSLSNSGNEITLELCIAKEAGSTVAQ